MTKLPFLGEETDHAIARRIAELVNSAQRIAITGHERPDGDCIGSEVALKTILEALGKQVQIVNADPTPNKYCYLDPRSQIQRASPETQSADLLFVLDATDLKRLGRVTPATFGSPKIVNIDHHLGNPNFGEINFVDQKAAAVGELIFRLASSLGWAVPELGLAALYTALVTDTGQFAYSNTTARVLRMAAELRDAGVDTEAIWRQIYLNKTLPELKLEARARASLECEASGKICHIALKNSDFVETGTSPQHSEDFVGVPRALCGVELALFFYEVDGGTRTKVSLRSTRNVDSCALAQVFGGGGHRQAAGCSFDGPMEPAREKFLVEARKFVGQ